MPMYHMSLCLFDYLSSVSIYLSNLSKIASIPTNINCTLISFYIQQLHLQYLPQIPIGMSRVCLYIAIFILFLYNYCYLLWLPTYSYLSSYANVTIYPYNEPVVETTHRQWGHAVLCVLWPPCRSVGEDSHIAVAGPRACSPDVTDGGDTTI